MNNRGLVTSAIIIIILSVGLWRCDNNNKKDEKLIASHSYSITTRKSKNNIVATISWKDGKTFMSVVGEADTKEESISKALTLLLNHKDVPFEQGETMSHSTVIDKNKEFLAIHGIIFNDDLSNLSSVSIKVTDKKGKVLYEAFNKNRGDSNE